MGSPSSEELSRMAEAQTPPTETSEAVEAAPESGGVSTEESEEVKPN